MVWTVARRREAADSVAGQLRPPGRAPNSPLSHQFDFCFCSAFACEFSNLFVQSNEVDLLDFMVLSVTV